MALPSRDQTFAYENCRDLLEKLNREIDRYCAVAGNDEILEPERLLELVDQLKDSAFNASVTALGNCATGCLTTYPLNNANSWGLINLSICNILSEKSAEHCTFVGKARPRPNIGALNSTPILRCRLLSRVRQAGRSTSRMAKRKYPPIRCSLRRAIFGSRSSAITRLTKHSTVAPSMRLAWI